MATERKPDRKGCLWLDFVQDHLDHRLPPDRDQKFQEHLQGCDACRAELDALGEIRAALREAAELPLPDFDKAAIAARMFDAPARRRAAWLVPAGALAAAAAAVLLTAALWPRGHVPAPVEPPAVTPEVPSTPLAAPLEPTRVTYLSGSVEGPAEGPNGYSLPIGHPTRVAEGAGLAVRLDPDTALAALSGTRLRVDWRAGWEVELSRGALAARLSPQRPHRFRVHCAAGTLEALGTAFSLRVEDDHTVRIALQHGRLRLDSGGRTDELAAPATATWSAIGLSDVVRQAPERWALLDLARTYDPDPAGPRGTLALTSAPEVARVLVDGRAVGDTPLVLALPAGERYLEVMAPGRKTYRATVALKADRLNEVHADLALVPSPIQEPIDAVAAARRHLAARRVAVARKLLDEHLAAHPDDARALLLAADAERIGGDPTAALDAYLRVSALTSDARISEAALFQAGLLRLNTLKKPAAALATFEALRRDHPRGMLRQEVAFHLAECYLATADYRRAVRALQDYLRLYPQGTKAVEARGLLADLEKKGWK